MQPLLCGYVSDAPNDKEQLVPGVQSIEPGIRQVEAVLVDSGFYSEEAVGRVREGAFRHRWCTRR